MLWFAIIALVLLILIYNTSLCEHFPGDFFRERLSSPHIRLYEGFSQTKLAWISGDEKYIRQIINIDLKSIAITRCRAEIWAVDSGFYSIYTEAPEYYSADAKFRKIVTVSPDQTIILDVPQKINKILLIASLS
jgi:hypothetical protein